MKYLFFLLLSVSTFASYVEHLKYPRGASYLNFLTKNNLPKSLYYDLDAEDQLITEEIRSGVNYQVLKDSNGTLEQVLIPLSDELQIHIYKDNNSSYTFEAIPIVYTRKKEILVLRIQNSPYYDIMRATNSKRIAKIFVDGFKNSLNFKLDIRKGDPLVMIYDQKYRFGKPFSMPRLQAAMVEMHGKRHYLFLNEDDRYYNAKGIEAEGFMLTRPVKGARISSGFTKRRFHPILKKYRAHLGIDYAVRAGTPIRAAGSGRIVFIGRNGGYGNVIKIRHTDGYMTLYAHQRSFRKGMRRGKRVKKGQVIGYVGTTGRSTGPHLHFGLYKNGRAINPARVVRVTTRKLKGKKRKMFNMIKDSYISELDLALQNGESAVALYTFDDKCFINIDSCKEIKYQKYSDF